MSRRSRSKSRATSRRNERRARERKRGNGAHLAGGLRPSWEDDLVTFHLPCDRCGGELQVEAKVSSGFGIDEMEAFARDQGWVLDPVARTVVCHGCAEAEPS